MLSLLSSGSNAQGQLGNGTLDDNHRFLSCSFDNHRRESLPPGTTTVLSVATGANHTLVLLELSGGEKEVWGCGDGRKGQLGIAYQQGAFTTTFQRLDLSFELSGHDRYSFKLIASTWETSYIVLSCDEGSQDIVLAMGSDDFGDLGVGANKGKNKFNVIALDDITGIYTGQRHVVLRLGDSKLIGWGSSRHGQLGDTASKPYASSPCAIALSSMVEETITFVSLGMQHTIVQFESGRLCSLGSNRKHQLEVANVQARHILSLACTWNGTYLALQHDGKEGNWEVLSSGNNSHSQLGQLERSADESTVGKVVFPSTLNTRRVTVALRSGSEHLLAIVADREIWGWGWNEHGNLGVGYTDDVPLPTKIWPPERSVQNELFKVHGAWGGMGTSWICAELPDEAGISIS